MIHAALAPRIGREFDPFLFAAIGEDRHGQLLSVISALARSDLDPWQEAVGLARMSRDAATARLSRLISALPGEPAARGSMDAIAGELIALLPRTAEPSLALAQSAAPAAVVPQNVRLGVSLCALVVMMAVSLLFGTHSPPAPGHADNGVAGLSTNSRAR
jgi:hypothetical protein